MSSIITVQQDLDLIVAKASTLTERLNGFFPCKSSDKDDQQVKARLQLWRQVVAKGNSSQFYKRLAWDGLDTESLCPLMANTVCLYEKEPLPLWANTLEKLIHAAGNISREHLFSPQPYLDPENPVPFEPFYIPFIEVARQKLWSLVGCYRDLLSSAAQADLERSLLGRLANICTSTLLEEFSSFRSSGNELQNFLLIRIQGHKRQEKYRAFIDKLFQDALFSLFEKYSALGRLVATAIDFWVESNAEFINRLATDWSDIEVFVGTNVLLNQVVCVKANLSDPHNKGRSVLALKFDTGFKIVYKPKQLGLDVAFYDFLSWCGQQKTSHQILPLRIPQIINRSAYGWMEYVESLPCLDAGAAKNFYQRSGMLLCLLYILEATDCHNENLIASGEYPILVDLETLLHHKTLPIDSSINSDDWNLAKQRLENSVTRTGLLPQWNLLQKYHSDAVDMSGLGATERQISSLQLQNINTDAMDVGYDMVTFKQDNAPTLNGTALSPKDYLEDLVKGFERMYYFLLSHQNSLLASDSPIMSFANQQVRYVFRNTNTYALIQKNSYDPSLLCYSVDRSIGLDILSRAFINTENKPTLWPLLAAELQAMEQLDIPFFVANTSSDSLTLTTGEVVPKIFVEPSFDTVINRIQNLSTVDLNQQVEIIRGSYYARFIKEPSPICSEDYKQNLSAIEPLNQHQLVQQAIIIAKELQQKAITNRDGSVTWFGFGYGHSKEAFQLEELSYGLYDGAAGVALFLAALTKITGDSQYRDLILSTLQPLRQAFVNSNNEKVIKLALRQGIDATVGLGSIVYALAHISQLLEDGQLLQDALKIASLITPSIATDNRFDIMGGSAGVILSLLALHSVSDKQQASTPLELAILCGEHLLKNQTSINNKPRAWKTWKDKQLTGFSQGAAGITYALLRLFAVTQDTRFLDAATEAISYERSLFSPCLQNWLDMRSEEPICQATWAHGAPGIGLARLGGLSVLDTPEIREEITTALETTQKFLISDVDNLCWGNTGRIETLLVASKKLENPEILEVIQQAVSRVISKAETQGTFTLFPNLSPQIYNPGFFHGTAGIGYQLLRIAYPDILPSILLWE